MNTIATIDVRHIAPCDRDALLDETFEELHEGDSFVVINDADPRRVYYRFRAQTRGALVWEYLQRGPNLWRIRVGRPGPGSADPRTVAEFSPNRT